MKETTKWCEARLELNVRKTSIRCPAADAPYTELRSSTTCSWRKGKKRPPDLILCSMTLLRELATAKELSVRGRLLTPRFRGFWDALARQHQAGITTRRYGGQHMLKLPRVPKVLLQAHC